MSDLTRSDILRSWEAEDKTEPLEVPEWGGTVYVRYLSAQEVTKLGEGVSEDVVMYRALVRGIVDAEGNHLFTDEDVPALMARPYATIIRVAKVVMGRNGMNQAAVEELVRDFDVTQLGDSSIESPLPLASQRPKREPASAHAS